MYQPTFGTFGDTLDPQDLDGSLARYTAAGLAAVQVSGPLLETLVAEPERCGAVRKALDRAGVACVGLAGYRNLVAPNPTARAANLAFLKGCFAVAPQLGAPVVATETGTRNTESDWIAAPENRAPATLALLDEALEQLVPAAEHYGAQIAIEGYVNNVVQTLDDLDALVQRFPELRVVCDPYNYIARPLIPRAPEITSALVERFGARCVLAHIKDVSANGAEADTPEAGTGVFPQGQYLALVRRHLPHLPLILEHLPFAHMPAAVVRVRGWMA